MKKIFISTAKSEDGQPKNTGVMIAYGNGTTIVNDGPEGAFAETETNANICLTTPFEVKDGIDFKSSPLDLEGKVVVQVGDEIIPYYIDVKDLPNFFNSKDTKGYGVQFGIDSGFPPISCTDAPNSIEDIVLDGQWGLRLDGETVIHAANLEDLQVELSKLGIEMVLVPEEIDPKAVVLKTTGGDGQSVRLDFTTTKDLAVDWGDGKKEVITPTTNGWVEHVYTGTKSAHTITLLSEETSLVVTVTGSVSELISFGILNPVFGKTTDTVLTQLTKVPETLPSTVKVLRFANCPLFNDAHVSTWDVSAVTKIDGLFFNATIFNQELKDWVFPLVKTLIDVFNGARAFNKELNNWDVSNITDISRLFKDAISFNQVLNNWNVSNVTQMVSVFDGATLFNQDLGLWDVSAVVYMDNLFRKATSYNQPMEFWSVRNVIGMIGLFLDAESFSQDLSNWCVEKILNKPVDFDTGSRLLPAQLPIWGTCPSRFTRVATFQTADTGTTYVTMRNSQATPLVPYLIDKDNNTILVGDGGVMQGELIGDQYSVAFITKDYEGQIEDLDIVITGTAVTEIVSVTDLKINSISFGAIENRPATNLVKVPSKRPLTKSTSMEFMFRGAVKFNDSNVSGWDVSGVTNFNGVFKGCTVFNQNVNEWDVSSGTTFVEMFQSCKGYNQPLIDWNMNKAVNINYLLKDCITFNRDIGGWELDSLQSAIGVIDNCISFVQDLSQWCVTNITEEPGGWSAFKTAYPNYVPVWGTCPRGKAPSNENSMIIVVDTTKPVGDSFILINSNEPSTIVWAANKPVTNVETNYSGAFALPQFMIDKPGQYQVSVNCGAISIIKIGSPLVEVKQWSGLGYESLELTSPVLTTVPNTAPTALKDFTNLFAGATIFNDPNVSEWIVDEVTKYFYTFQAAAKFNQPLNAWNVEAAVDMTGMFEGTTDFDQDLSQWCVSGVTTEPTNFNRNGKLATTHFPVWGTCPGKIIPVTEDDTVLTFDTTNYSGSAGNLMFNVNADASIIWPNGAITNLEDVTPSGNLRIVPLNDYIVNNPGPHRVIIRQRVSISYYNASNYLTEVNQWSRFGYSNFRVMSSRATTVPATAPPNLTNYTQIFKDCSSLNTANVVDWDVSKVLTMDSAFENASTFNQDLSKWDVSAVVSMNNFLHNAAAFSHDLSTWCVGQILSEPTNFAEGSGMFGASYPIWGTCPSDTTKLEILLDQDTIEVGATTQAVAVTTPNLAQTSIGWVSQTPDVATIDSNGLITGVSAGIARIHCLYNDKLGAFINITVNEAPPPPEVNKDPAVKFKGNSTDPVTVSVTGTDAKWELLNAAGEVIQADTVTEPYVGVLDGEFELRVSTPNTSELNVLVAGPGLTDILSYPLQSFNSVSHFDSSAISSNLVNVPAIGPSVKSMFGMFRGAGLFNSPNLSLWSVKQVENMGRMLDECSAFSQDLSKWCVPNFSEAPPVFNGQGQLTPAQLPVWGTCPRVNPAVGRESTSMVLNSINFAAANSVQLIITTDTQVDVVWGDGSKSSAISTDGTEQTFTIRVPDYIKNERGEHYFVVNNTLPCKLQLIGDGISKILKWSESGFKGLQISCTQLTNVPPTAPPKLTDYTSIFSGCNTLNDPNVAEWDVSKVTTFVNAFVNAYAFNQDIGKWNVSSTKNSDAMNNMLINTMALSQDLSKWCVTNVTVKPLDFNEGSALTNEQLPVWGTCPVRA